jgi:hypothetical protein
MRQNRRFDADPGFTRLAGRFRRSEAGWGAPGKIAGSLVTPDQAGQADHLTVSRAFTVAN